MWKRAHREPNNALVSDLTLLSLGLGVGVIGAFVLVWMIRKRSGASIAETVQHVSVVERVRSVGKLVGLEVHAKEIATSTRGWSWLPPILLSQAKVAMIFHFEKQYAVDLGVLRDSDVEQLGPDRFRFSLPTVEGALRLTNVTPYDIQAGRVLGLLDVIQMNAQTQKELIESAQGEASRLFEHNAERYEIEAKRSIERHLGALMKLVGLRVEVAWREPEHAAPPRVQLDVAAMTS